MNKIYLKFFFYYAGGTALLMALLNLLQMDLRKYHYVVFIGVFYFFYSFEAKLSANTLFENRWTISIYAGLSDFIIKHTLVQFLFWLYNFKGAFRGLSAEQWFNLIFEWKRMGLWAIVSGIKIFIALWFLNLIIKDKKQKMDKNQDN